MKYSYSDIYENCTHKEYIDQFNPVRLELGETYIQAKGTWHEKHYLILFCNEKIALGITVGSSIGATLIGEYDLFYVANGFKYCDTQRPIYRLSERI